jgi:hypothetical protein
MFPPPRLGPVKPLRTPHLPHLRQMLRSISVHRFGRRRDGGPGRDLSEKMQLGLLDGGAHAWARKARMPRRRGVGAAMEWSSPSGIGTCCPRTKQRRAVVVVVRVLQAADWYEISVSTLFPRLPHADHPPRTTCTCTMVLKPARRQ